MPAVGLGKLFTTTKVSHLSILLLAVAAFWYSANVSFNFIGVSFLYLCFYAVSLLNVVLLLLMRQSKTLFCTLWLLVSGLCLNYLKTQYGLEGVYHPQFIVLLFLLPFNWLFLLVQDDENLYSSRNFKYLCAFLLQIILIEKASAFLPIVDDAVMPWFVGEWLLAAFAMLAWQSVNNKIKNSGIMAAFLSLSLAFIFYADFAAVAIFIFTAALILLVINVQNYTYTFFRDELTGVYGRRTYYRHAASKFPLKYSLGVICIDDYPKLLKVFGVRKVENLTRMIVSKIMAANTGADIYRYNDDEFILVFNNEDKKQSYEYLEAIRRSIAGSEFVLSPHQIVKVTISAGVSEKKRSDADAEVVLTRTREVLQKAYKFTQNLTSKA